MRFLKNMARRWSSGWPALILSSLLPPLAAAQNADPIRVESGLLAGMPVADPAARAFFKEYLAE